MSADWKAGDRAVCVDASPVRNPFVTGCGTLTNGTIYLVDSVDGMGPDLLGEIGLHLCGVGSGLLKPEGILLGWASSRFRKVVPQCDRQAVAQEREATK